MSNQPAYLRYIDLESRDGSKSPYRIACMVLNRPQQANCFNGEMLDCLVEKLKEVKDDKSVATSFAECPTVEVAVLVLVAPAEVVLVTVKVVAA